jgi:hypothetical protein
MDDYEDSYIEDAPEAIQDAPERQEAPAETNYEAEARKQGWKPREEFDGPSDKWRPAKEFVDRGNEDPRILRSRVDKLDKLYEGVKRQWQSDLSAKEKEFNERVERLNRVSELALKSQRETYERQIESAKRAAVAEGDAERYDELTQHQTAVKQQWAAEDKEVLPQAQPAPKPNGVAPAPLPEVDSWMKRNTWFNKDPALTDEATAYEDYLAKARPGLSLEERLEETRKHVVAQFPHKFGKKAAAMNGASEARRGASPVEGSQRGASGGDSDGGFSQLPKEARDQFKAFVKEKLFADDAAGRAKYAKYYDNPNADKVNG